MLFEPSEYSESKSVNDSTMFATASIENDPVNYAALLYLPASNPLVGLYQKIRSGASTPEERREFQTQARRLLETREARDLQKGLLDALREGIPLDESDPNRLAGSQWNGKFNYLKALQPWISSRLKQKWRIGTWNYPLTDMVTTDPRRLVADLNQFRSSRSMGLDNRLTYQTVLAIDPRGIPNNIRNSGTRNRSTGGETTPAPTPEVRTVPTPIPESTPGGSSFRPPLFPGILDENAYDFAYARILDPTSPAHRFAGELTKRLPTIDQAIKAANQPLNPAIEYKVTPSDAAKALITEAYWSVIAPAMVSGAMADMPPQLANLEVVAQSLFDRDAGKSKKAATVAPQQAKGAGSWIPWVALAAIGVYAYFGFRSEMAGAED
jgi:hypothetical protein